MRRYGVESALLILIGFCLAAAEDLFFRTQPVDTTVNEGETAVLRCKVSNLSSVHYLQWVKDGVAINHPNRTRNINRLRNICDVREPTRYSVVGDFAHGEFNLEIVHTIASEDEDSYRCIVFDDFGPVLFSSEVELTVRTQSAASYPVCLPTTVRDAYVAGDVLHTECLFRNAEPLPELSWSRNNRRVSAGELIYPLLPDKKRDWVLTAEDDGAVITCQATGPAISDSQACVIGPLVVYYAPTVTVMPEIVDVSVHDSAIFTCSVVANPKPDAYFWQTNRNPIDLSTGRYSLSANGENLTISQLTIFDDGFIITCIVENVIGQTSASAVLYILEAPAGPSTQRNVTVTETPEREDSEPSTTSAPAGTART
ncbi:kin of IRRE-like protein 1 [Ptychodera flava]|uniref:kin of IRRE-like protein 1 n=1 Tax=Ptychodera flava TaxID=63121 RepID=UPI003969C35B